MIGKFLQVCMEDGDEVLYPSPGYPIYESQINFLGGVAVPYVFRYPPPSSLLPLRSLSFLPHITWPVLYASIKPAFFVV